MKRRTTRAILTLLAGLSVLGFSVARAQCPVDSKGLLSETDPAFDEPSPDENFFCDGVLPVDCGGFNPGFLLDLELAGRFDVDLTCTSTLNGLGNGRVCAVTDSCGPAEFTNAGGIHRARLQGDYASTSLRLMIAGSDPDCHNITTVRCTGSWGYSAQCFRLHLNHTGEGGDPIAVPAQGENCPAQQFRAGDEIEVQAAPAPGWEVERWSGTSDDASTADQNSLTIKDGVQTVLVVYREARSEERCYSLLRKKTGQGRFPVASPSSSDGCASGKYTTGERIDLIADPAPGWTMDSWRGTVDNSSTSINNQAVMDAADHTVRAVYQQESGSNEFSSGFEVADFSDWTDFFCTACDSFSAFAVEGLSTRPQSLGYDYSAAGEHVAHVRADPGLSFVLELLRWTGLDWVAVAAGHGAGELEVRFWGAPGLYQWQVTSLAGSGPFELVLSRPGGSVAENRLLQTSAAARTGDFGLESVYERGVKGKAYLVDESPGGVGGASTYRAEFRVRPNAGLRVKGKKQVILEARNGKRRVFELIVVKKGSGYGVRVRPRVGGKSMKRSPSFSISADTWTRVGIEWRAGSDAGADDGFVRLLRNSTSQWEVSLDNAGDRVDSVRLGQATSGSKKTAGTVYFDDFESNWDG